MDVHITGRHVDVTDELRTYMERKIPRLEKHTDRLQTVEFVLEKNRFLHRAEVRLKAGVVGFTASETDPDPKRAFDLVIDKAERRLSKELGVLNKNKKHRARQPNTPRQEFGLESTLEVMDSDTGDLVNIKIPRANTGARVADVGLDGRRKTGTARRAPKARTTITTEPVWLEKLGLRVFSGGGVQLESMSTEEAAERLFFEDENFLCYTNKDSGSLNVIYRRKDGNFAVVEPGQH